MTAPKIHGGLYVLTLLTVACYTMRLFLEYSHNMNVPIRPIVRIVSVQCELDAYRMLIFHEGNVTLQDIHKSYDLSAKTAQTKNDWLMNSFENLLSGLMFLVAMEKYSKSRSKLPLLIVKIFFSLHAMTYVWNLCYNTCWLENCKVLTRINYMAAHL